jgi:hypothetical protein
MRYLILTIITMSMVFTSDAQLKMKRNGFGVHAGVTASNTYNLLDNFTYNDAVDPGSGFLVGMRYNFKLGPLPFGVCSEINFINVNYNFPQTSISYTYYDYTYEYISQYSGNYSLNYVSVPILFKLYLGPLNIHAGAQFSQLMSGTRTENYPEGYSEADMTPSDIQDPYWNSTVNGVEYWDFEEMDIAAVFGLGVDLKMGLYLSLRTAVSVTPVQNIELENAYIDTYQFGNTDLLERIMSSQMTVGWKF